jgi:hypothetical protein
LSSFTLSLFSGNRAGNFIEIISITDTSPISKDQRTGGGGPPIVPAGTTVGQFGGNNNRH